MKMNCVAFAISGQKNSLEAAMRYQKANEILPKELVEFNSVLYGRRIRLYPQKRGKQEKLG